METVRIEFNSDGFRALLESDGVQSLVSETADGIASRANANAGGDGFVATTQRGGYGGGRWIGFVKSTTKDAAIAESENKALTRAIQG